MSSLEFVGKFIGAEEIESVCVSEKKTPMGAAVIEFTFKTGKMALIPEKTAPYVISDKATDLTAVQEKRMTPVIRECMSIIMEYDLDFGDLESLVKQLHSNLTFQFTRAENSLWGRPDEEFVPGFDVLFGVTLLDAYRVLEQIPKKSDEQDNGKTDTPA
jgi:hypothetical protein